MQGKLLLSPILDDDALTRGLADPEARILVEWLVERVELLMETEADETAAARQIGKWCRRGRAIGRFVALWCHQSERGAATQLAAAERFSWPLPQPRSEPCEIMHDILVWESDPAHCGLGAMA